MYAAPTVPPSYRAPSPPSPSTPVIYLTTPRVEPAPPAPPPEHTMTAPPPTPPPAPPPACCPRLVVELGAACYSHQHAKAGTYILEDRGRLRGCS